MPEPFDYKAEFDRLMLLLPFAAGIDLDRIEETLQDVDTLGPILDPTAWMRGQKNIDEQKEVVAAVAPLIRLAKKYQAAGKLEPVGG
jgi:hypothetical protein